jgi:hypothetical protein
MLGTRCERRSGRSARGLRPAFLKDLCRRTGIIGWLSLGATLVPQPRVRPPARHPRVSAGATLIVIAFCLVELGVLGYARAMSGIAHLHALQSLSDPSAWSAAAACTEGVAAIDDFWPALPLLNAGRAIPSAAAHAWGQVPLVLDVAREICPVVQLYANIAPWPERSIQDGVAADLLDNVRRERSQLVSASAQLSGAWSQLDELDLQALSGDSRLARVARVFGSAREQQADIADALTLTSPEHLEHLLGADVPRSIVLSVNSGDVSEGAYMVLHGGRLVRLDIGDPSAAPVSVITVDHEGLASVVAKLTHLQLVKETSDAFAARAVLGEIVRLSLTDDQTVGSALRRSADEHHAWLWFDDPALQALAARRGWVRQ